MNLISIISCIKFQIVILLFVFNYTSIAQTVTCSHFSDSLHQTSDTIYINQPADTTANLGIQWMGHTDLSYMICEVNYHDSGNVSISGGTVTGGLFSPYPNPVFFPVDINYVNPSIPSNTAISVFIDFVQGNMVDTCSKAVTFIINSNTVSVPETKVPELRARVYPNPMTNAASIEVSDQLNSYYRVLIYNSMGSKIFESDKVNKQFYNLNSSVFKSTGLYFIELHSQEFKPKSIKLMVK